MREKFEQQILRFGNTEDVEWFLDKEEFDLVKDVVAERMDTFDNYKTNFELYDEIKAALDNNDIRGLRKILFHSYVLYVYNKMLELIDSYTEMREIISDLKTSDSKNVTLKGNKKEHKEYLKKYKEFASLPNFEDIQDTIDSFAKKLLPIKNKKYSLQRSIETVFRLTINADDDLDYVEKYIRSLMLGNDLTWEDVSIALIADKPEMLIKKVNALMTLKTEFDNVLDLKKGIWGNEFARKRD